MRRREHPGDSLLLLAVDGELSRHRQAAVDAHVSQCAICGVRLNQIRSTLAEASALCQAENEASLPSSPYGRVRLEHALREAADEGNQPWLARQRDALAVPPGRAAFGLAAALVLLMVWLSGSHDILRDTRQPHGADRAPLPVAALTPGAVSGLTAMELCAGARPSRLVTAEARQQVLRDYRMENVSEHVYELDALITPELGGTTDADNLWPQRYESPVWNARVKDELERLLPELVCNNRVELAQAQREIATDWVAAYKRYFRTDMPLQAHVGPAVTDDDDLEYAPVRYVVATSGPMVPLSVRFTRR